MSISLNSFEWESVERVNSTGRNVPYLSIRRSTLMINSMFYDQIGIDKNHFRYVRIQRSKQGYAILLQFLTKQEHAAEVAANPFTHGLHDLKPDGGAAKMSRRNFSTIGCGRFISSTPWLLSIAKEKDLNKKRFVPIAADLKNFWIIPCVPGFENEGPAHTCNVNALIKGIYCYVSASDEILYIGQGHIKNRFRDHKSQKDIPAKFFRWTAIEDSETRLKAEHHHLASFRAKHGRLPEFNRQNGHGQG